MGVVSLARRQQILADAGGPMRNAARACSLLPLPEHVSNVNTLCAINATFMKTVHDLEALNSRTHELNNRESLPWPMRAAPDNQLCDQNCTAAALQITCYEAGLPVTSGFRMLRVRAGYLMRYSGLALTGGSLVRKETNSIDTE